MIGGPNGYTISAESGPVKVQLFFTTEFKLPRSKVESGLTSLHQLPGSGNVFFVLHQKGMIWRVEKTAAGEEKRCLPISRRKSSVSVDRMDCST